MLVGDGWRVLGCRRVTPRRRAGARSVKRELRHASSAPPTLAPMRPTSSPLPPTLPLALALCLPLSACRSTAPEVEPFVRDGDEIVVAGEYFEVGAPVVLWYDPGGYSAYRNGPFFRAEGEGGLRYTPGRRVDDEELLARTREEGWTLENLREAVDQFVIHYDVCGTSQKCFDVLQDQRGLSVHFLLDVDGTIYQTLDLKEQAWHARQANRRSVGVEIAQIGARTRDDLHVLDAWYPVDEQGPYLQLPESFGDGGVRTANFQGRPARPERFEDVVNGVDLVQHDFTPEQYRSLGLLTAALHRALPRIALDAPRDATGAVSQDVLSDDEFAAWSGLIGHHHVTSAKTDPGPAFDWERVLEEARAALETTP